MSNTGPGNAGDSREEFSGDTLATESPTNAATDLVGIFKDGVIGAVAGAAGTVMLSAVLFVALNLGAFDSASFGGLAELVGLGADPLVGYVIFFGGGMTTWPLLYAVLNNYLPGQLMVQSGVTFATIAWTGFLVAFYTGQSDLALVLYLLLTLVAHWVYGAVLGATFGLFSNRTEILFISTDTMSVSKES